MSDRSVAVILGVYSLIFLGLHVVGHATWAVGFVPPWGRVLMVVVYAATFVPGVLRHREGASVASDPSAVGVGVGPHATGRKLAPVIWIPVAATLFWLLRDHRLLGDGPSLVTLISSGYQYDPHSLAGKFLQSLVYRAGHACCGLSVSETWPMTSVAWGLVFIPVLASVSRELFGESRARIVAIALVATQATTAYYFGYIEDYVAPSVLVLFYIRASARALRGEGSLLAPGFWLAATLLFSMAWAFIAPSLLWFAIEAARGRPRTVSRFLQATLSCPAALIVVMTAFHFLGGVDIIDLYRHSHAADASQFSALSRYAGLLPHLLDQIRLHLLVAPYSVLLVALLLFTPRASALAQSAQTRFLTAVAVCALLMGVFWFPGLGMHRDWDLFALVGAPLSLLASALLAAQPEAPELKTQVNRALVLAAVHAAFWIWSGHTGI